MTYKVVAVSNEVKLFSGRSGMIEVFNLKLEGVEGVVQLNQKAGKTPPQVGEVIEGQITSNQYGQKLKRDYAPKQEFGNGSSPKIADTTAMYVAYAKDLMVSYIENAGIDSLDEEKFLKMVNMVGKGAMKLQGFKKIEEDDWTQKAIDSSVSSAVDDLELPEGF